MQRSSWMPSAAQLADDATPRAATVQSAICRAARGRDDCLAGEERDADADKVRT